MRIGIDIDNVISNFDIVLFDEFLKHDKELRNTGVLNPNLYMTKGMFDWTSEELDCFYQENIERIAKSLDVIDEAKETIQRLKDEGNTIIIITSRDNGDYTHPYEMTYEWLNKKAIVFDELILVHTPLEKVGVIQDKHIDIMIDDSIKVCAGLIKVGIPAILMDTPYNRNMDILRAKDWREIYEYITKN